MSRENPEPLTWQSILDRVGGWANTGTLMCVIDAIRSHCRPSQVPQDCLSRERNASEEEFNRRYSEVVGVLQRNATGWALLDGNMRNEVADRMVAELLDAWRHGATAERAKGTP